MIQPIVVVQARTSSSRLPAKVLLDFHGLPVSILVAKRAASTGLRVVLATSDDTSDDALESSAKEHGIECIRGPLENVLGRFVEAICGVVDQTPVVRLTADNIVPDGELIDEVIADFNFRKLDYITTGDISSGLPYGCGIEITLAGHLREAASYTQSAYNCEHVTPWIRQRYGVFVFEKYESLKQSHFRTTIDCLEDYAVVHKLFSCGSNPIDISWREIINRLRPGGNQPIASRFIEDMVLGTAQLGMKYGIASLNTPDICQANDMVKTAIRNGITSLDTASAYGESEKNIGKILSGGWHSRCDVITKLSPLLECMASGDSKQIALAAENSLLKSCRSLGVAQLGTVLLHRCEHLTSWGGIILEVLRSWQEAGDIKKIGVSVQSPNELELALSYDDISHIQLPYNILDHRWSRVIPLIKQVRKDRTLTVHVRSALLQGLLTTDNLLFWERAHVEDPLSVINWLKFEAKRYTQSDVATLCLSWVRGLDWVDGVVVGCDSLEQLKKTVTAFDRASLDPEQIEKLIKSRPYLKNKSLDPAKWLVS